MVLTDAAFALSGQPGPPMLDFSNYLTSMPAKFIFQGTI